MAKKIIVAEDQDSIRELIGAYLGRKCLEVELCENAEQLLEKIKNTYYDLVLTDNYMSGIKGIEAVRRIRETDKNIPIYVMSGRGVEIEALQAGATGYIQKPFGLKDLDAIVDSLNPAQQNSQAYSEQ